MKKNKKLLLASIAAMGVLAMGVGATSTFAWYQVADVTVNKEMTGTGSLTVADGRESIGDIDIIVTPHDGAATSLVYTNRTGRSYMRSGDDYIETKAADVGTTLGTGQKQASMTFDVKICSAADNDNSPTTAQLAAVAGTYTVKVTAGGSVKASLTQTTTLGSAETGTPSVNFANPSTGGTVASGALGKTASAVLEIMQITISNVGAVEYKLVNTATTAEVVTWDSVATSWANADLKTAVETEAFYYGLEVLNATAEETPAVSSGSELTPSVVKS